MIHKLSFPVTWDGENVQELEFQRPKGKHLKRMPAEPTMKDLLVLASKVCKQAYPPSFFDELDGVDVVAIAEVMGDFLTTGQATGQS